MLGPMEEWVAAWRREPRGVASAAALCELAADRQIDVGDCLQDTGIERRALTDPAAEITAAQELRLIENLLAAVDDPEGLGLQAGARYHLTTYGIYSYALLASKTVRDANAIAMQFVDLTYAFTRISAVELPDGLTTSFDDPLVSMPEAVRRFVVERDVAAALMIWREGIDPSVTPLRATLRLPAPRNPPGFEEVFGLMPEFDAERSQLTWHLDLLDLPLPQASELEANRCVAQCAELLDRRHARRGVSGRVRDELLRSLGRPPTQEKIARVLHVSVRTLRRQLADEGTSFRLLVEHTRRGLAEELLGTGRLTVEQVADRVGYAEASSFVHAFSRWHGVAPRRWAQQQTAGR
jgi:AraC-like DNA-binding protein